MPGDPEWLDSRIDRAKERNPSLAARLDAVRPVVIELVSAEAAFLGDLVGHLARVPV